MGYGIGAYKFLFEIKLIGESVVYIRPIKIPVEVHNYPSSILYMSNNGYIFEKRYYDVYYRKKRLIIPPFVRDKIYTLYDFNSDKERYINLKLFKENLIEFTKSGFFGNNPNARVVTYDNYWYVH